MDCLVVVGTTLETNLAAKIVGECIQFGILIIEVNLKPVIRFGKVRHVIQKSEDVIPSLCKFFVEN